MSVYTRLLGRISDIQTIPRSLALAPKLPAPLAPRELSKQPTLMARAISYPAATSRVYADIHLLGELGSLLLTPLH